MTMVPSSTAAGGARAYRRPSFRSNTAGDPRARNASHARPPAALVRRADDRWRRRRFAKGDRPGSRTKCAKSRTSICRRRSPTPSNSPLATCAPAAAASKCISATADPLHRGQPQPSGQQGRAVRQGLVRDHAALFAGAAAQAAEARRRARQRRVRRDRMGRGAGDRDGMAVGASAASDPEEARLLHRPRPEPVADRLVGDAIRHAELRRPWRLLLGQHGGGRALHDRRLVLGIRRARLGARANISCCSASPRTTIPIRSRSASASSRRAAPRSSRSTRCAPAIPPSPTNGSASGPAPTACSFWR